MSNKIYAISDSHGKLGFKIPPCDLLIHAGDVAPDFAPNSEWGNTMQVNWLNSKWLNWLDEQSVGDCLATFGNHDFIKLHEAPGNFRVDESVTFKGIKLWFSPWSNLFRHWAWMARKEYLKAVYNLIPDDTDIIVSHQPPYGYGDKIPDRFLEPGDDPSGHLGSKELLATIDRVKPKVVIVGHIHSGFGTYQHNETTIYNVALVNEEYKLVNPATEIVL